MSDRTIVGVETLRSSNPPWAPLRNKRTVALVHAASALPDTLTHTVDAIADDGLKLAAILAPEHGFRGDRQAEHGDPKPYVDADTGFMVHSVYRKNMTALSQLFQSLKAEIVLVDIQDAGTRLYTFIWTLYSLMEAASTLPSSPTFLIADRPNPLGGNAVEGPLLNMSCCASRYGFLNITHRHGLTVAEAAHLFAASIGRVKLAVVPMINWSRDMYFDDTGLPWLPPSPNLPTSNSAIAYAATVFIEATTASEGRGTTQPFERIGAPFLNASRLVSCLQSPADATRAWRKTYFIPTWFKHNGTVCAGAELVRPGLLAHEDHGSLFREGVRLLAAVRDLATPPSAFAWDGSWFGQPGSILIDRYAGTPRLRELLDAGKSADEVADAFEAEAAAFAQARKPHLLYTN